MKTGEGGYKPPAGLDKSLDEVARLLLLACSQRSGSDALHGTTQDGGGAQADTSRSRYTPRDPRDRRRRRGGRAPQESRARQDDQVARLTVQQVGVAAGDGRQCRQDLSQPARQPSDGGAPRLPARRRNAHATPSRHRLFLNS